jgi:hypothetical protein
VRAEHWTRYAEAVFKILKAQSGEI